MCGNGILPGAKGIFCFYAHGCRRVWHVVSEQKLTMRAAPLPPSKSVSLLPLLMHRATRVPVVGVLVISFIESCYMKQEGELTRGEQLPAQQKIIGRTNCSRELLFTRKALAWPEFVFRELVCPVKGIFSVSKRVVVCLPLSVSVSSSAASPTHTEINPAKKWSCKHFLHDRFC